MGAYSSTHLTPEEIGELEANTHFTSKEIEQLYHRFKKLDRSRTGVISRLDFQLISELTLNPMSPRILSLFQTDNGDEALSSGGVTFDCFVKTLNFFNVSTPDHVKMDTLFRAYDCDGDGLVSEKDLRAMLRYYVGPHLSDITLRVMVKNTMNHALAKCEEVGLHTKQQKKDAATTTKPKSSSDRNNTTAATAEVDDNSCGCTPEEVRGLNFEQFQHAIGLDALSSLDVHIPLRFDE